MGMKAVATNTTSRRDVVGLLSMSAAAAPFAAVPLPASAKGNTDQELFKRLDRMAAAYRVQAASNHETFDAAYEETNAAAISMEESQATTLSGLLVKFALVFGTTAPELIGRNSDEWVRMAQSLLRDMLTQHALSDPAAHEAVLSRLRDVADDGLPVAKAGAA